MRPISTLHTLVTEVPSTPWSEDFQESDALAHAPRLARVRPQWRRLPGVVQHGFTHFPLELLVYAANVPACMPAPAGTRWLPAHALAGEALPSLMRKVAAHAMGEQQRPVLARRR